MPDREAPDEIGCMPEGGVDTGGLADAQVGRPQNGPGAPANPYCFVCGKTPVQLCFKPDGAELGSLLKSYFIGLKQGEGIP